MYGKLPQPLSFCTRPTLTCTRTDAEALCKLSGIPITSPCYSTPHSTEPSKCQICFFLHKFFRHSLAFFLPFRHQDALLRWWSNQVLMLQNPSCSLSLSFGAQQRRKSKITSFLHCTLTLAENVAPSMINCFNITSLY